MEATNKQTEAVPAQGIFRREIFQKYFSVCFLFLLILFFALQSQHFLTFKNFGNILQQSATLIIVAMGGTFVIMSGSIDLSVGSVVGLSSVITAGLIKIIGLWAIPVGILVGTICGLINGFIFSKVKIPSFITTLGMMIVARGVVLVYTRGMPITVFHPGFLFLGQGRVLGIPFIVILALLTFLLTAFISQYTVFGRNIRAIGGQERVSLLSGINVDGVKLLIYVFAGALSGLGGVAMAARLGAGTPLLGDGMELDVIAAVVLGGTPLTGGIGSVLGTIVGALTMIVLGNGLNIMGISSYTQMIIKGIVLVLAVAMTIDREKIGVIK
ncbi:MAG: ABC transporter permease [Limnochordia bacterium]|jgi:ribose transport system permease protein